MGYVRITIMLRGGGQHSGVRHFAEPVNFNDIRQQAWLLSLEVLGQDKIADITLQEVPADDPAVVALILRGIRNRPHIEPCNGEHPYVKQQQRKPRE